jgi:hypothetical protein
MRSLLEGAYDLHIHSAPDVVKRRSTDVQIAKRVIEKKMKGYVVKSHYFNTAGRASLIREMFPECHAVGAVVLNNSVGGLNPAAVEMAAATGTKIVWFPTMDAQNMWDFLVRTGAPVPFGSAHKDPSKVTGISILKGSQLVDPVLKILDLIKKHDMVLATGHISIKESLALLGEARQRGLSKLIATHVEFPPTLADIDTQKEYVKCGAKVEHNYLTIINKDYTFADLKEQIRAVGAENVILSSDLGQIVNPEPADGFEVMIKSLLKEGISKAEIHAMIVSNPAALVE